MVHVSIVKQRFYAQLIRWMETYGFDRRDIHVNGRPIIESGKVLSIRFNGVDAESLLLMLDAEGICAAAGSACSGHEAKPSHVLMSMGLTEEEARSTIRFSFSKYNTIDEMVRAAQGVMSCVYSLRKL
jgi:cysteine desulfurase